MLALFLSKLHPALVATVFRPSSRCRNAFAAVEAKPVNCAGGIEVIGRVRAQGHAFLVGQPIVDHGPFDHNSPAASTDR